MIGFVNSVPVAAKSASIGASSFATPLDAAPRRAVVAGPTMALRQGLRKSAGTAANNFGGVSNILTAADDYMARSVTMQYKATACPTGTYGVQCTEATSSYGRSADAARVAALNAKFRMSQRSPSKLYGDMYENRRQALKGKNCHHEETQFTAYSRMSASFVLGRSESLGTCDKYAIPESVEEAAMMRYIHIQQQAKAVGGVIPSACVEGASKGAAEDARVAQLASKYRNAQKPTGQLLQEKYNQVQHGLGFSNGCNYEEGVCVAYPAVAASFRPTTYGF